MVVYRGEAAQVHRLQQSVQPIIEPDYAHAQTHGVQALRLRPVRKGLPAQGRPAPPPRLAASVHGSSAPASAPGTQQGPQIRTCSFFSCLNTNFILSLSLFYIYIYIYLSLFPHPFKILQRFTPLQLTLIQSS